MLKVDSYSAKGIKGTTQIILPKEWEAEANESLLAQAIRVYDDRNHIGLRKAKTRAEVLRTGKKLYSQKGTGGARHGSRRAPVFVGGGVALGPRPVKRELTLSTALKRKAIAVTMTMAVKEKRVIVSDMNFAKTKDANNFIEKVLGKNTKMVTFVIAKDNFKNEKFLRNIEKARVNVFPSINAYDIYFGGNIVLDKAIFAKEEKKETKKK